MGDEAGPTSRPSEPVHSYSLLFRYQPILLVIVRIRRALELRQRMLFQLLHHHLDCFIELRIVPVAISGWVEIDVIVWSDADILNLPFALKAVNCRSWRGDKASIQQLRISANPH